MSSQTPRTLNELAYRRLSKLLDDPAPFRVAVRRLDCGAVIVDAGIDAIGGLSAGLEFASICLADKASVSLGSGPVSVWPGPWVTVSTDWPMKACMASQYAGWSIAKGKYFAMASGPMRAAAGKEPLIGELGVKEESSRVVGVLETRKIPPDEVAQEIAKACGVPTHEVFLLVAPTASQAGTLQVVARSIETALHKLHELKFDLSQVESGWGTAPLPPVAKDDLTAIGWTNDAVLYGASVSLWVNGDDASIQDVVEKVPSSASPDFGRPFLEIFERYQRDFYKIDPLLFSPARVTICNRKTGNVFVAGAPRPDLLAASYRMQPWN